MSNHSYNLDNLTEMDDGERECPHTGADHKRLLQSAVRLKERSSDNENFYRELSDASNQNKGIECIAEFFGRALMTPLDFVESSSSSSSRRSSTTTSSSSSSSGGHGSSQSVAHRASAALLMNSSAGGNKNPFL